MKRPGQCADCRAHLVAKLLLCNQPSQPSSSHTVQCAACNTPPHPRGAQDRQSVIAGLSATLEDVLRSLNNLQEDMHRGKRVYAHTSPRSTVMAPACAIPAALLLTCLGIQVCHAPCSTCGCFQPVLSQQADQQCLA